MVKSYEIASVNRDKMNIESEAYKRFKDRGYSQKTLKNYCPNPEKAKFLRKDRGFNIYEIPLKKGKCSKEVRKVFGHWVK